MFRCLGPLQASLSWLFAKHAITMSMLAFIFSALSLETPWQRTFVVNTVCAVAEVFAYDNSLRAMYLGNELSKRRMWMCGCEQGYVHELEVAGVIYWWKDVSTGLWLHWWCTARWRNAVTFACLSFWCCCMLRALPLRIFPCMQIEVYYKFNHWIRLQDGWGINHWLRL